MTSDAEGYEYFASEAKEWAELAYQRQVSMDEIYDALVAKVELADPNADVNVYQMETLAVKGARTFSLVDSKWLYETFCKAYPDAPYLFMPHQHIES